MTTLRFTENQVEQGGYDFSELLEGQSFVCRVERSTYWDSEKDELVTKLMIERLK